MLRLVLETRYAYATSVKKLISDSWWISLLLILTFCPVIQR